jgi:hypothetical protein
VIQAGAGDVAGDAETPRTPFELANTVLEGKAVANVVYVLHVKPSRNRRLTLDMSSLW